MADKTPEKTTATSPSPAAKSQSPATSPSQGAMSPSPAELGPSTPAEAIPAEDRPEDALEMDDTESALGESVKLSTASLTSSMLQYRTLHGRRYHSDVGDASYWAANDEKSSEAMDLNHHGLTILLGDRLHLAPLEKHKIQKALDIGTGTGLWAIDFADEYPEAEVIGTDISPIQTTWVPPNLKFELEDCSQEWTFDKGSIDYIHIRWLIGSIADWDALFVQAFDTLSPGGWLESYESCVNIESDHAVIPEDACLKQWSKFFVDGGEKLGRTFLVVDENLQRKAMETAGFVDIKSEDFKRPMGTWPKDPTYKEVGGLCQLALETDAEGHVMVMASTLGWSKTEVQVYIAHLRQELRSNKFYPYYRQRVIWGRKPE